MRRRARDVVGVVEWKGAVGSEFQSEVHGALERVCVLLWLGGGGRARGKGCGGGRTRVQEPFKIRGTSRAVTPSRILNEATGRESGARENAERFAEKAAPTCSSARTSTAQRGVV